MKGPEKRNAKSEESIESKNVLPQQAPLQARMDNFFIDEEASRLLEKINIKYVKHMFVTYS